MKRLSGTVRRDPMGPGVWILETDEGQRVALAGSLAGLAPGARVVVEGRVRDDLAGPGMTGDPVFWIERIA